MLVYGCGQFSHGRPLLILKVRNQITGDQALQIREGHGNPNIWWHPQKARKRHIAGFGASSTELLKAYVDQLLERVETAKEKG